RLPALPGGTAALRRSPRAGHGGRAARSAGTRPRRAVPAGAPAPAQGGRGRGVLRLRGRLPRPVRIHYRRPPDRETVFRQVLVHEGDALVTWVRAAGAARTTRAGGAEVLWHDSPVVWFTFPGLWHDIGRFHRPDGTFTGLS